MTEQHLSKLHDRLIGNFALNKNRLMAYLAHLTIISKMNNKTCVWPTPTSNINASGWELSIFMADTQGASNTGICFKSKHREDCLKVCMHINEQIFDIDYEQARQIVGENQENEAKKLDEHYDKALAKIVSSMNPESILQIPGVYEAISEEYNNTAMDIVKSYQADPSRNNLDMKYTIKEVLEILVNDLEALTQIEDVDLSDQQKKQFKRARESVRLGQHYLDSLQHILNSQVI